LTCAKTKDIETYYNFFGQNTQKHRINKHGIPKSMEEIFPTCFQIPCTLLRSADPDCEPHDASAERL